MSSVLKAGTLAVELISIDKNVLKSLDRVQAGFTGLSAKIRDSLMTMAAFRTTFQGFSAPLQVFANFEAGISKVKAITQATTEQIAGNKLNETEKKLDEIESHYNSMSEKQYNDKIKELTDNVRKDALGDMFKSSGTFSAFDLGSLDNSIAKEQLDELRIIDKEVKCIGRKNNVPRFK
ncbi:MAG: hypothetical protein LBK82_12085 [Planctomycetaceae bacterium]|jgi:hypothetical protein|nr:hypothetical protein [Planctomycetaceae bacterium]